VDDFVNPRDQSPKSLLGVEFWMSDSEEEAKTGLFSVVWEEGKGYWIEERISMYMGSSEENPYPLFDSSDEHWKFDILLKIREFAYGLVEQVPNKRRGHWQVEWSPERDYSREPRNEKALTGTQ
jgi:hypothetical protein